MTRKEKRLAALHTAIGELNRALNRASFLAEESTEARQDLFVRDAVASLAWGGFIRTDDELLDRLRDTLAAHGEPDTIYLIRRLLNEREPGSGEVRSGSGQTGTRTIPITNYLAQAEGARGEIPLPPPLEGYHYERVSPDEIIMVPTRIRVPPLGATTSMPTSADDVKASFVRSYGGYDHGAGEAWTAEHHETPLYANVAELSPDHAGDIPATGHEVIFNVNFTPPPPIVATGVSVEMELDPEDAPGVFTKIGTLADLVDPAEGRGAIWETERAIDRFEQSMSLIREILPLARRREIAAQLLTEPPKIGDKGGVCLRCDHWTLTYAVSKNTETPHWFCPRCDIGRFHGSDAPWLNDDGDADVEDPTL